MKRKLAFAQFLLLLGFLGVSCGPVTPQPVSAQNVVEPITATTIPSAIGNETINGVTITIDWVLADARRVSFGYTIEGLPEAPEATDLFGSIQLVEKSGTGELGWGGHSTINRVEDSPGTLVGSWSSVFAKPFTQPKGQFSLDIALGDDNTDYDINFSIASFPFPSEATPHPPNVFPPKLPDHKVGDFHFDFEAEIHPLLELVPAQAITANNVEMRLERLEITASFMVATLCYSKPSPKDWMTDRTFLKAGAREEGNNTYSLIFDLDYGEDLGEVPLSEDAKQLPSGRCVQVEFLMGHSNQPGTITLTIPRLEQSVPEVIPDDEIAAAREKLLPLGIDMDWEVVDHGAGPVYNKLPEGMTTSEAYQLFLEALGYIYEGPWEFTVDVKP